MFPQEPPADDNPVPPAPESPLVPDAPVYSPPNPANPSPEADVPVPPVNQAEVSEPQPNNQSISEAGESPPQTNPVVPEAPFQSLVAAPAPPELHAPLSGVVVIEDSVPESALPPAKKPAHKPKAPLIFIILGLLFILGGGGASAFYLMQSQPERIWSHALQNTSNTIDDLITKQANNTSKGGKVSGTFKITKPLTLDGTLESQFLGLDSSTKISVSYSSIKVGLEALTLKAGESDFPDAYIKLSGLESLASVYPGILNSIYPKLNNQWVYLDAKLFDQLSKQSANASKLPSDTAAQQKDLAKIAASFISKILQSDSQHNVFEIAQKIGKEKFNGHSTYHFVVTVNKDHLKNVVDEMKTVIDSTSFKSVFPTNGYDEIKKSIGSTDFSKTKIELWADTSPAIVRNIRLSPTDGMKAYVDIGSEYTSGDEVPLTIKYVIDDKGTKGSIEASLKFNSKTSALTFASNGDVSENSANASINYNLSFTVTPSDDPVKVTAPAGAKSYQEILNSLGFPNYDLPTQTGLSTYGCQYTRHLVVIPHCQDLLKPTS